MMRGEEGEERDGRVSGAGEAVRARAVGGRLDVVPLGPLVGPVHCEGEKGACERARRGRGGASEGNALLMKSDAERNLALRLGWGPVVVSKRSLGRLAGLTFDIVERERGEGRRGGGGGEGSRWELVGSAGAWRWLVRVLCAVQLWTRRARVRCRSTSSSSSLLSLLLPTLALHQCRHPCSSFRQAGQSARETPTRSSPSQVAGPSPLLSLLLLLVIADSLPSSPHSLVYLQEEDGLLHFYYKDLDSKYAPPLCLSSHSSSPLTLSLSACAQLHRRRPHHLPRRRHL